MKRTIAAFARLCLLLAAVPCLEAQYLTVTGTGLSDASGALLGNATIAWAPVLSTGKPISFRKGVAGGQATVTAVTANVVNGAFSIPIVDTAITSPANICYQVTVTDNTTGQPVLQYGCVQPASTGTQAATWCTSTVCNFDAYAPAGMPGVQQTTGPKGDTGTQGPAGSNGVASLASLAQLRLATLPAVANFFDPARKVSGYFVDANSGAAVAQAGYMRTGPVAANSGGAMVFNTAVPVFSVTAPATPGSSTANVYDYTQQSGPANGQIIDATTGSYISGTYPGYGSTPFEYVYGLAQVSTNAPLFCGYNNSGIAFYDQNKSFISGITSCTNGLSNFTNPYGPISVPSGAYWMRTALLYYNSDGSNFITVSGTSVPATYVPYAGYPTTTRANGIALLDQNLHYLRGIPGPLAANTSFTVGTDVAFIDAGFAGDPSATLEVLNGTAVPSGYLPFIGAPVTAAAQTPPTLQQLWPAMAGLDWWLPLNEGTGSTLHDITGNGHNATITGGGTAAAWAGFGLQLNGQTAAVPNAAGRAAFGFCADFPSGGAPGNYGYVYSLAAGGQNGYNLAGSYGPSSGIYHGALAYYPVLGRSNGGPYSIGNDGFSGHHCASGLQDGSVLVDGREVSSYLYKTASDAVGGGELSNPMNLIGGNGSQTGTPVTLYSAWGGPAASTAVEIARQQSEMARLRLAGVSFGGGSASQLTDDVCTVDGTSIDQGFQAGNVRPVSLVSFTKPCTVSDFSVSGQGPMDMANGFEARAGYAVHPYASRNIAYFGGVTNGVVNYNETAAQALADTLTWNRKAHAAGYKTIATTMMSRCGNNQAGTASGDSLAQAYNALLLASADEFDWLDNLAAWPALGATNACSNTTYFADGVHITSGGGQPLYVQNEQAAFNGVYRNPNPRVITASANEQPQDAIVTANCAAACTLTLLDANSVSFNRAGRLMINNIGAGTVTVTPVAGETINGAASRALATGNSLQIVPYVANPAAGGANWIAVQQ